MYARVFCRSERVYMYVMYACVRVSCVRTTARNVPRARTGASEKKHIKRT